MELFERYYTSAIRFLARRPRSSKEIRDNLSKKKAPEEIITAILKKLQEQKFQNDNEFAQWWVDQRTRFKAKSDRVIKLELRQKGISDEVISEVFANEQTNKKSDKAKALAIVQKYQSRYGTLTREERYRKLGGLLARRGFDWEVSKAVIDDIFERGYNTD